MTSREKLLELHLALDKATTWITAAKIHLEDLLEEHPGEGDLHREEAVDLLRAVAERNAARREARAKVADASRDDQNDSD